MITIAICDDDTHSLSCIHKLVEQALPEGLPHVHVCGVMAMASLTDDMDQVAREFDLVRRTYIMLKDDAFDESEYFNELSMGMSDDWQVAVKYGATLVRIGTAIFGPRKY